MVELFGQNVSLSHSLTDIGMSFDDVAVSLDQIVSGVVTTFTSIGYWIMLIVVIAVALGMVYLFFWSYYKALITAVHMLPRIEGWIAWVDTQVDRLKGYDVPEAEAEMAGPQDRYPDEGYRRRDD